MDTIETPTAEAPPSPRPDRPAQPASQPSAARTRTAPDGPALHKRLAAHKPALVVTILGVVVAELGLYSALAHRPHGGAIWLVLHLLAALAVFVVVRIRRDRGAKTHGPKRGLFGRLRAGGGRDGSPSAPRAGGGLVGRLRGLFGRKLAPVQGLGGAGGPAGAKGAGPGGGKGGGFARPAGPAGLLGRFRSMLGRRNPSHGSPSSGSAGSGGHGGLGPLRNLLGGLRRKPSGRTGAPGGPTGAGGPMGAGPGGGSARGRRTGPVGRLRRWLGRNKAAVDKALADIKPPPTKATPAKAGSAPVAAPQPTPPIQKPQPQPQPEPRRPVEAPHGRNRLVTEGLHREDMSLQGWGRRLKDYGTAAQELNTVTDRANEQTRGYATALRKLAVQAGSEMPASSKLTAEIEAAAAEAEAIANEEEALATRRRKLQVTAEGFNPLYGREHEADEERLNAPRKGLAAESRADVSRARQDV